MKMDTKLIKYVVIPFFLVLVIQRFFHLYSFIENPHSWRQLDTLFYAYDYYKNGIDLLSPSVSWMGGYKTVLLEFPILPAILSFMFHLPGNEVIWMRVLCLVVFLGSAFYLFKLISLFNSKSLAFFTAVVYMMLPLSIYYSRALIADFAVMLCSLAMMYYYVRGLREENVKPIIAGTLFAVLGVMMKVPYMFIAYIPLGLYILKEKKSKTALRYSLILIIPITVFYFWQSFVSGTNGAAPDWYFIPDYFKFSGMSSWYFGEISDRLNWENWKNLLLRIADSGITYIGVVLFFAGIFLRSKTIDKSFFNFYWLGLLLYLLIFPKLNFIHDYYQIPFLAGIAFYIGVTLEYVYRKFREKSETKSLVYVAVILVILGINGIWFTERWYYKPDNLRIEAAGIIKENTSENDLVITSIEETDPRDPRLNAPAYRYGWAIRNMDLSPELIDSLKNNGATHLAYIVNESVIPEKMRKFIGQNPPIIKKQLNSENSREILIFRLQ